MEIDSVDASNSISNSHHRKIELQSPLDLTYLQTNLAESSRQKLDLHFPLSAGQAPPATVISLDGNGTNTRTSDASKTQEVEEDPLRLRVRGLVDAFLARTWSNAIQNITINGLDATSMPSVASDPTLKPVPEGKVGEREGIDFTYSAYDNRLQEKVASLYGELEGLTAQVSRLRREAPTKGASMYEETLKKQLEKDENMMQELDKQIKAAKVSLTKPPRENWHEDAKTMYERGLEELSKLAGLTNDSNPSQAGESSLTETVGKVQRARTVMMELE